MRSIAVAAMIVAASTPAALIAAAVASTGAAARPARCETTGEGAYPCDFEPMGRDGSFAITARGKPRYAIVVDDPGEATAFSTFPPGTRNVSLPGTYRLDPKDPGCWVNAELKVKICAR